MALLPSSGRRRTGSSLPTHAARVPPAPGERLRKLQGMSLVGRPAELGELAALLDRAAAGFGGAITVVGPAGSGKSALAAEAAALARDRGFEVAGGLAVRGRPGRLVWAGLLDDLGADSAVSGALLGEP